ncbi:MAG: hypothetical protein IJN69_02735 [Oscillospiraceae bacterium]|nr:hypothetical protein [Oscillospiraceae bacterium]
MKKYCIVNTENKIIKEKIEQYGYICISTEKSDNVSGPISCHADVLYLKSRDNQMYISDCQHNNIRLLSALGTEIKSIKLAPGYKTESKLNMIITDDIVIANPATMLDEPEITESKEFLKVKQGYTKCSTAVIEDDNFITEDEGIYKAVINAGKNCLLIAKGFVELCGYEYGFIGGASAYIPEEKTLLFLGDITKHPDFEKIMDFCEKIAVKVKWIDNLPLKDIGGIVKL